MRKAIFSGSFDPFTVGHMDILLRASRMFDAVVVGVLSNPSKRHAFSIEERRCFAERAVLECGAANVNVASFDGLLADFARSQGAMYIVRGLRSNSDFEYELPMERANRHLADEIETVYLISRPEHAFISSGIVREIGALGGDINGLVPASICKIIAERLSSDEQ